MSFYREQILPRLTDLAFRGEVLEVGFGSGLTMPAYPPAVTRVRAVEPSAVARELAAGNVAASAVPVDYTGADAQAPPLENATTDHVVSIMTPCTIPDPQRALAEIRRVLRPGGTFHVVEHGLSPKETVARWQHRLTPLQRRVFGGCHINRPIDRLVAGAGLKLTRLDNYYLHGPGRSGTCPAALTGNQQEWCDAGLSGPDGSGGEACLTRTGWLLPRDRWDLLGEAGHDLRRARLSPDSALPSSAHTGIASSARPA